jgi:hypothetical protein
LLAGVLALAWLVLRSGPKPSRLAYPCQQAAFSTAAAAFGVSLVGVVVAIRRRLLVRWLTPTGITLGSVGLIAALGAWSYLQRPAAYQGPFLDPRPDYVAQVFNTTGCPQDPVGDRFICVEDLIEMMGAQGIKLHRSSTPSLTAGPEGILAADDVVLIKINYQWPERGGTNTDLLRGLIRRIVDHPDSFTGEIVVVENTQFAAADNFDRSANNAQDQTLSPYDVVQHYRSLGHKISHYVWTAIRNQSVQEYSDGDMTDGYVVLPYDAQIQGRVSYPKFRSVDKTRISLKYGVWNELTGTYDRERLKFINLPVLKSHHATYGATAMVKNYMGVVTGNLSTNSHSAIRYGLLGALNGEIQLADLNILDAIWINANPFDGPWTGYAGATRVDSLVASLDPVAGDLWAVKNILIPGFIANGYSPPCGRGVRCHERSGPDRSDRPRTAGRGFRPDRADGSIHHRQGRGRVRAAVVAPGSRRSGRGVRALPNEPRGGCRCGAAGMRSDAGDGHGGVPGHVARKPRFSRGRTKRHGRRLVRSEQPRP